MEHCASSSGCSFSCLLLYGETAVRDAGDPRPWTGSRVEETGALGSVGPGLKLGDGGSPRASQAAPVLRGSTFLLANGIGGCTSQPWGGDCEAWAGSRAGLPPWEWLRGKQGRWWNPVGQPSKGRDDLPCGQPPSGLQVPGSAQDLCQARSETPPFSAPLPGLTPVCSWAGLRAKHGWPWPQSPGGPGPPGQGPFCPAKQEMGPALSCQVTRGNLCPSVAYAAIT